MGGLLSPDGRSFKVAVGVGVACIALAAAAGIATSFSTSDPRTQSNTVYDEAGVDAKLRLFDRDFDDVADVRENRVLSTDRLEQDSDADCAPDAWEAFFGLDPNDENDGKQDPDRDALASCGEYEASLASLGKRGFTVGFDPAKGLSPLLADTDEDQLPDGWEVKYGLDPLLASGLEEDIDGDGLTNRQEHAARSDPTKFDTDGDGLSDGREVNLLKTDPASRDSDKDGMDDAWEVEKALNARNANDRFEDPDGDALMNLVEYGKKTEPRIADTDGDGIPDGWEVDFGLDPTSFADGVGDPDADGLTNAGEYRMRLGLYQQSTDPLNPDTDLDGLLDGEEASQETNPFRADTDRDGLTDGEELHTYYTKPLTPDSDGDDLSDGDEVKVVLTNATLFDTDTDNLPDGEEFRYWNLRHTAARAQLEQTGRVSDYIAMQFPGADQETLLAQYLSSGDADKDGLSNIRDEDSDGDDMKDGDEVATPCGPERFLDPLDPDTDRDRMPDRWEFNYKLNPCDARDAGEDADGDGVAIFKNPQTNGTLVVSPPNRPRPEGYGLLVPGAGLPKFTNLMEYQNKTSPIHSDHDCDGLPDGWEVYYRRTEKTSKLLLPNPSDKQRPDTGYDYDADGHDYTGLNGVRDGQIKDDENFTALEEWYYFTDPYNNNTDGAFYEDPATRNVTFVGDGTEVYLGQDPNNNPSATVGLAGNGRQILELVQASKKDGSCHPRYDQIPVGLAATPPAGGLAPGRDPPPRPPGPAPDPVGLALASAVGLAGAWHAARHRPHRAGRALPLATT